MTTSSTVRRSEGRVTRQKVVQRAGAVERGSLVDVLPGFAGGRRGTASSAGRTTTRWWSIAIAGMTRAGSLRNGIGAPPGACITSPTRPASGVSMKRQIRVTMVTDSTEEREEQSAEERRAAGRLVQRQRQRERDHRQRRDDDQGEHEGIHQGLVEDRVGEPVRVIARSRRSARRRTDRRAGSSITMPRSSG